MKNVRSDTFIPNGRPLPLARAADSTKLRFSLALLAGRPAGERAFVRPAKTG